MAKGMIMLMPILQFFDNNGKPLSGGSLTFYVPNSTTLKNTYTDSTLAVANPNPITLDSAGRPDNNGTPIDIFLNGQYKLVVKDSSGTSIRTENAFNTVGQVTQTTNTNSSTYNITTSDRDNFIVVDATSTNVTINLLAAATAGAGFFFSVKKMDSSAHTVTLQANGAETIDGSNTFVLSAQNDTVSVISDGTQYWTNKNSSFTNLTLLTPVIKNPTFEDPTDTTKQMVFDLSGETTGKVTTLAFPMTVNRTITFPDATTTLVGKTTTDTLTNKTLTSPVLNTPTINTATITTATITGLTVDNPIITTGIKDGNNNNMIDLASVASAVNELKISNAATGNAVQVTAGSSTDTNVDLQIFPRNNGRIFIKGVNDASNAPAGYVGEIISSTINSGSAVSLTSGTTANITSINLTAGQWSVKAYSVSVPAGGTTTTSNFMGINTTSATLPTPSISTPLVGYNNISATAHQENLYVSADCNISSTTTIYLVYNSAFSGSTNSVYGALWATRIR